MTHDAFGYLRWATAWPALVLLVASFTLLGLERRGRVGIAPALVIVALALAVALAPWASVQWAPLAVGLVVAALARDGDELLHGECALKLLWVMGPALALSWAGLALVTVSTGTPVVSEQWAVLSLGLDPRFLWSTALPLSLLVGVVMLGIAPFHFWIADVFQGVRPWLAAPAVVAIMVSGAAWLTRRVEGISGFPSGALLVGDMLRIATVVAFAGGAATLLVQRRPERRVGTLASLNGALLLAALASGRPLESGALALWAGHLALALAGASTVARFLPVPSSESAVGAPLFRRHPWAGLAGLYAMFSLAGVPGTPGAWLWLTSARALLRTDRPGLLLLLVAAWLVALNTSMRQWREAFGVPDVAAGETAAPVRPVPWPARAALWAAGLGVAALAVIQVWPRLH
jgi:NADH:ubiquinone oxidoreductase subunit 2 (subunit N)